MRRGDIYVVDLGPAFGHEAGGTRPVVVVSDDVSNATPVLVAVVPATPAGPTAPRVGVAVPSARSGHPDDLVVSATQVRTLDAGRFPEQPSGAVPDDLLAQITFALRVFLDIP